MNQIERKLFQHLAAHPEISLVCFDFFDTLVYRTVEPEYAKQLACKQMGLFLGRGLSGRTLYQWRRTLESKLCTQSTLAGKDPEFSIGDLASEFFDLLNNRFSELPSFISKELFVDIFISVELDIENRIQKVFDDTQNLPKMIRQKGVKTAVISDFYIPEKYFKRFLGQHGFIDDIEKSFISCDFGLAKSSGKLYDNVLIYYGCNPENILMIGDNAHSDIRMPREKGIQTFSIDRKEQKSLYRKDAVRGKNRSRDQLIKDLIQQSLSKYQKTLFPEMAVTLWRFTHLLFNRLMKDNVQNIFFLSKEGELLRWLFNQYQEVLFQKIIINSNYLFVSRKSTFIGSLKPLGEEDFSRVFLQYRSIAPRDFLLSLNFSEKESIDLCLILSVDFEKRLDNFPESKVFNRVVGSPKFAEIYERKRQDQKRNFLAYLNSFKIEYAKEELHLVDVGWKGSIQDNIFFTLEQAVSVSGYYIGLLFPTNLSNLNRKTGILFSNWPEETLFFEVFNSNRPLFEMILEASHGSAEFYHQDEKLVTSSDPTRNSIRQNNVCIYLQNDSQERKLYEESILPIQKQIKRLFNEINEIIILNDAVLPKEEWYARQHARMVYKPRIKEIRFFESLFHLENFGVFEATRFQTETKRPFYTRMRNLKRILKDPQQVFDAGFWAPVVLRQWGLGFVQRAFGIYQNRKSFSKNISYNPSKLKKVVTGLNRLYFGKNHKIAFLTETPESSRVIYPVLELALGLKNLGFRVYILTKEDIHPSRYAWHPEAGELEWFTYDGSNHLRFDFAIATGWKSCMQLRAINADNYFYYLSAIEHRHFPNDQEITYKQTGFKNLCEKTYLLPLPIIVNTPYLQKYLLNHYGQKSYLVTNGIRKSIFSETGESISPREFGKLRVLIDCPHISHIGMVKKTIDLCRQGNADEIWLLTSSKIESITGADRVFSKDSIWEHPPIFRSCDLLITSGPGSEPSESIIEMFHCGGTAIRLNAAGRDELLLDDINGYVVGKDDEAAFIERLNLLKRETKALERLKKGAKETANRWPDWKKASHHFKKTINTLKHQDGVNRKYLNKLTNMVWDTFEKEIEISRALPFYKNQNDAAQFLQVYWHNGRGFSEAQSMKLAYHGSEWNNFEIRVKPSFSRIQLRIDPCVLIGVVCVKQISIDNLTSGTMLQHYEPTDDFKSIQISGTASRIDSSSMLIIESADHDPQLLFPFVELDDSSNEIAVRILFKFLPYRQALRELLTAQA